MDIRDLEEQAEIISLTKGISISTWWVQRDTKDIFNIAYRKSFEDWRNQAFERKSASYGTFKIWFAYVSVARIVPVIIERVIEDIVFINV